MSAVIEIAGLHKTFHTLRQGRRTAVDGFDLLVESGQVHGFLGPNGSGKTTTLRALLGLVRADGGRMSVLGAESPGRLPEVAGRVGAIVESPQFFANFTARRTLRLLALAGGVPTTRVDAVLEQVGLRDRGDERVRGYSLGMKQRLAVASALLKNPELLILDEPANGLDPAGIREMRDLMRSLAAAGVTVLLSSHILAEIQLICDHVTIISRGRRVAHGRVDEVLAGFDQHEWRVGVAEPERAAELLARAGVSVTVHPDHLLVAGVDDAEVISRTLGEQGLWVRELVPLRPDLESVFLELTGDAPHPALPRQVDGTAPDDMVIDLDVRESREVGA
ncbi:MULTISPECIES: ATP-binding cassette domain-containing protein [Micromonospora]|uniref:ATP-binding cassette domain-containing protein n=1 Tax=Micromonospora solifontis TaxID=2487138 RepID=A0ABX9WJQ5_9ACTN|nr:MULTISPECIES: ATP-binding cassette domain-containing protein [Micromonospora]NES14128.1 ATP-binding cassette domain-containing protein [Micromonospora sp. PPF5-17B]NES35758.1 ATP-binding cassette domain-containing protein [Micromonospora solifontis]NES55995.1 ATP-binding cassette domain-containing protein [Micromonospora sp. PPF5-6]RNM00430.1 ATP-binding cassette domain-containing protein [Micromonospora solifontis]